MSRVKFKDLTSGQHVRLRAVRADLGEHIFLGFTPMGIPNRLEPRFRTLGELKTVMGTKSLQQLAERYAARGTSAKAVLFCLDRLYFVYVCLSGGGQWRLDTNREQPVVRLEEIT